MRSTRIKQWVGFFSMVAILFMWMPLSEAAEINFLKTIHGKAQERMGVEIKELGWLEFNRGRVQEELGGFIQEGGREMKISQEALGSGIAAAGHILWQTKGANVRLAHAIVRTADIVAREASIMGPAAIQARLGAMILANAQTELVLNTGAKIDDVFDAARHQEGLGREIVRTARFSWASEEMGKAVFATTQGRRLPEISGEVIQTVQIMGGFGHAEDFRIGLSVLAGERGREFTQLMPSDITPASESSVTNTGSGWGGFAEYGLASVGGFIFVMWLFANSMTSLQPPMEKGEEVPYEEYRKAA
jgi:hypothetical protein